LYNKSFIHGISNIGATMVRILLALLLALGSAVAQQTTDGRSYVTSSVTNGRSYAATNGKNGKLYQPATGSVVWTCAAGGPGCTSTTVKECAITATTFCTMTVPSTAAGSVEILCAGSSTQSITFSSSSDGTWNFPANANSTTTNGTTWCAVNLNATGGATSITCTASATVTGTCYYMNFTYTGTPSATLDTSNNANGTASTTPVGLTLTLNTGNNYLLIQDMKSNSGHATSISSPYTLVTSGAGSSIAYAINQTTGAAPTWAQSVNAIYLQSGLAIY
jgi:hypothetical protein